MSAKMMYAFDHIPAGQNSAGGNVAAFTDFPWVYQCGTGSYSRVSSGGTALDGNGLMWLCNTFLSDPDNYVNIGSWRLPFSVYDLTKARSWVGFRWKWTNQLANNAPLNAINSAGAAQATLVAYTDGAWVLNQEHYIEVMIDWINEAVTVWVDGKMTVNGRTIGTYKPAAGDLLSFSQIARNPPGNPGPITWLKDVYIQDDPGDGSVGRLGPQLAKPITLASASGNGWTPSTGTILAALNTPVNTSTPTTPNVVAATDGTPLVSTLQTTADAGAKVNGVLLLGSGMRAAATTTVVKTTLTDQATPTPNQLALADTSFPPGSFGYGKTLGFMPAALDGTTWNAAKIAQLTMKNVAA